MTTKVIKLRSLCTKDKFQYHLNFFINRMYHKARYVIFEVKFITEEGKEITLGEPYYLDMNSENEIRGYKYYLTQFYSNIFENNIKQIVFSHITCTRKIYLSHIDKIREEIK